MSKYIYISRGMLRRSVLWTSWEPSVGARRVNPGRRWPGWGPPAGLRSSSRDPPTSRRRRLWSTVTGTILLRQMMIPGYCSALVRRFILPSSDQLILFFPCPTGLFFPRPTSLCLSFVLRPFYFFLVLPVDSKFYSRPTSLLKREFKFQGFYISISYAIYKLIVGSLRFSCIICSEPF